MFGGVNLANWKSYIKKENIMSFKLFFDLAVSFERPIAVPVGTHKKILKQIESVESELGYTREKYLDNPWHWRETLKDGVSGETFCEVVKGHNAFVRSLYDSFQKWVAEKPGGETEIITVKQSRDFFPGLKQLSVPYEKWSEDYFEEKLENLYEIIRGRDQEGVSFDAEPLSEEQAGKVILLLHEYIVGHKRFSKNYDVPHGCDYLADSEDTAWCEQMGWCVHPDDIGGCDGCDEKCDLYQEYYGSDDDEA